MSKVFIGGSRRISHLSVLALERLENVVRNRVSVLIGDANGADKAVQVFLHRSMFDDVTVYCSGEVCRNNVGSWTMRNVKSARGEKSFQFYAEKDREMASDADYGLMLWDGSSAGTLLNVYRLVGRGKKVVLLDLKTSETLAFASRADWDTFFQRCPAELRKKVLDRTTPQERSTSDIQQSRFAEYPNDPADINTSSDIVDGAAEEINSALEVGDSLLIIKLLRQIATAQQSHHNRSKEVAARDELLERIASLGTSELPSALKLFDDLGLRLTVQSKEAEPRPR